MPFAQHDDVKIYYDMTGTGPPLLLINGLGGDTRSLGDLIAHLEEAFTVISFDLRGAGKSDKPDEPYTIRSMADDTVAMITHLDFKEVHVMGFSMGGCVAMDLALDRPDLVRTLTLVSTLPSWKGPHPVSASTAQLFHQTEMSDDLLRLVYERVFGPRFKQRISADEYVRARMIDNAQQPAHAYLHQLHALEKFDACDRVKDIAKPAFIVAGDADEVVPPANAEWLHGQIAGSELLILEGVGHTVTLEAPQELADIMTECLL